MSYLSVNCGMFVSVFTNLCFSYAVKCGTSVSVCYTVFHFSGVVTKHLIPHSECTYISSQSNTNWRYHVLHVERTVL